MSCVLRISGKKFDVDRFLAGTNLKPYLCFRKGEVMPLPKKKKFKYKQNGCSFDLSFAEFSNFGKQQKDAIRFLKKNFIQLKSVYKYNLSSSETPVIDFGIETRMGQKGIVCQSDYFIPELLKLVGDLGFELELTQYPSGN